MSARTFLRYLLACSSVALLTLGAACSIERTPFAADCVQGRAVACTCDDGALGATTCAGDGVFGACQCAALSSGGQAGTAPPFGNTAGLGGAGGSSGTDSVAAGNAAPVIDAGASPGENASDGMTPSDSAVDGGEPDAMIDDAATVEPPAPGPGQLYGPCRADSTCDTNLFCTYATLDGTVAFCTMFCSVSGFGEPCPAQPGGRAGSCVGNVCAR